MKFVVPASAASVDRVVAAAARAAVTYAPTHRGPDDRDPDDRDPDDRDPDDRDPDEAGFADDRVDAVIGSGERDFAVARDGLRRWRAHHMPGIRVLPSGVAVVEGATCVVAVGTPVLALAAPCRVVDVVDEPRRFGFSYRTLPGHPEQGEESFTLVFEDGGDVRFVVAARSRPATAVVRVVAPVARRVQHLVARRYLRALAGHVSRARDS
jgi:uncharacterized protein (UPF0548 family)